MKHLSKNKGNFGEKLAENFYKRKGFKILERNFYCKSKEIDIIAEKDGILYFIEVKSVSYETKISNFEDPALNFNEKKLKNLQKAILCFLKKKKSLKYKTWRLLLLSVKYSKILKKATFKQYDII